MVERFAEAVLADGVAPSAILTLTFTEKAAAELRERIRRRFTEAGEDEHARARSTPPGSGTIHGFCARMLRAQPLAAGLDPRFTVLDEAAAKRLATGRVRRRARGWVAAGGRPALDLAAAYGWDLEQLIVTAHAALRSRGHERAAARRSRPPRRAARPGGVRRGRRPRPPARSTAPPPASACSRRWRALATAERLAGGDGVPLPSALEDAKLAAGREGARARRLRRLPRGVGGLPRRLRRLPRPARPGRCSTTCWPASPPPTRRPRPRARPSTSTTSSCACATCWRRPRRARPLGRALRADHGRRVPGHEPAAARRARGARARQPVRGRRRVPVDLRLPARRRAASSATAGAALPPGRVRGLTVNFRSQPEILDVVNGAFGPAARRRLHPPLRRPRPVRAAALRARPAGGAARRAARGRARGLGGARGRAGARHARAAALAPGRGARGRRADARGGRRGAAAARARRAHARDDVAAPLRAGAGGAGAGRRTWSAAAATGRRSRCATASPTSPCSPTRTTRPRSTPSLASPFCGAGTDALVLLAEAGRAGGRGAWAALREAEGAPWLAALPEDEAAPAARLRPLRRRRAAARRAAPGRGAARARDRPHGLRPRDPRPRGRRPPAREPAQAHAARPRVRAGGGPRPARLPRLRGRPGPGRGARGRGRARVRRARRRAADDDPPREGARVPRGLRRRSRPRRATRRGRGC